MYFAVGDGRRDGGHVQEARGWEGFVLRRGGRGRGLQFTLGYTRRDGGRGALPELRALVTRSRTADLHSIPHRRFAIPPTLPPRFEADRDRGDFSVLPELHALSSGLKALCTWIAADGIEECRWGVLGCKVCSFFKGGISFRLCRWGGGSG